MCVVLLVAMLLGVNGNLVEVSFNDVVKERIDSLSVCIWCLACDT